MVCIAVGRVIWLMMQIGSRGLPRSARLARLGFPIRWRAGPWVGFTERVARAATINAALQDWSLGLDKDAAAEALQQVGVAAGPVATAPDMLAEPQAQAREFFVPYERYATPIPEILFTCRVCLVTIGHRVRHWVRTARVYCSTGSICRHSRLSSCSI